MVAIAQSQLLRPLTYDDLVALPDDGKRYELINGELSELTGPTPKHQRATRRLTTKLDMFVTDHELGEVFFAPIDVVLSPYDVIQPDIVFVAREHWNIVGEKSIIGVPDALMEVLSPSTRRRDLITKAALYASVGVPEYWLIDPERETIQIQTLKDRMYMPVEMIDGRVQSTVIAGFRLNPSDIFATADWMR